VFESIEVEYINFYTYLCLFDSGNHFLGVFTTSRKHSREHIDSLLGHYRNTITAQKPRVIIFRGFQKKARWIDVLGWYCRRLLSDRSSGEFERGNIEPISKFGNFLFCVGFQITKGNKYAYRMGNSCLFVVELLNRSEVNRFRFSKSWHRIF